MIFWGDEPIDYDRRAGLFVLVFIAGLLFSGGYVVGLRSALEIADDAHEIAKQAVALCMDTTLLRISEESLSAVRLTDSIQHDLMGRVEDR